jgi:hypothetical protein
MEAIRQIIPVTQQSILVDLVWVTPPMADAWLAGKAPNRSIKELSVDRMAKDMLDRTFAFTHQGIAFDKSGRLVDGQNRLTAIVQSGCTIPLFRFIYMDDETLANALLQIDNGTKRSPMDGAHIAGLIDSSVPGKAWSIARQMIQSGSSARSYRTTDKRIAGFIVEHIEALTFALNEMKTHTKGISRAGVIAAIARAYYHCDHDRLAEFCRILKDGICASNGDKAAIRLREFVTNNRSSKSDGGSFSQECYRKTENAILHFMNHNPIEDLKCRTSTDELFPITSDHVQVK